MQFLDLWFHHGVLGKMGEFLTAVCVHRLMLTSPDMQAGVKDFAPRMAALIDKQPALTARHQGHKESVVRKTMLTMSLRGLREKYVRHHWKNRPLPVKISEKKRWAKLRHQSVHFLFDTAHTQARCPGLTWCHATGLTFDPHYACPVCRCVEVKVREARQEKERVVKLRGEMVAKMEKMDKKVGKLSEYLDSVDAFVN